jgi:hypothetical protein
MPGSHLRFVRTLDFGVLNGLGARGLGGAPGSVVDDCGLRLRPARVVKHVFMGNA